MPAVCAWPSALLLSCWDADQRAQWSGLPCSADRRRPGSGMSHTGSFRQEGFRRRHPYAADSYTFIGRLPGTWCGLAVVLLDVGIDSAGFLI